MTDKFQELVGACAELETSIDRVLAEHAALLDALKREEEWRGREEAGAIDPEWDYETMVGAYRRAAIQKAEGTK